MDLRPEVMDEIATLPAEGFTSLKLFMAYKNVFQIDDTTLFKTMQKAAENGMIVMVHAENGDVEATLTPELLAAGKTDPVYHAASRPREIEGEATNRAVVMAGLTGCRLYVVHVTNELSVDAIRRGRAMGYPVMGETCIQYFFMTVDEHLAQPDFHGAKYVCSPPIRTKHDQQVLWRRDPRQLAANRQHRSLRLLVRRRARDLGRSGRKRTTAATGQPSRRKTRPIAVPVRNWARATSPKSPTACPLSKTA